VGFSLSGWRRRLLLLACGCYWTALTLILPLAGTAGHAATRPDDTASHHASVTDINIRTRAPH